jgi:hypothetical protein
MMKDQLIEMIRGYERAGYEDMKQLGSALNEPKVVNQILKDLGLISSLRLTQLRDQVQTMQSSQIEELHELFGEELPSQGIKPKGPIDLDAVLNHQQDVNLVVKVTQLEDELASLINKNNELQQIIKLYQFNLQRISKLPLRNFCRLSNGCRSLSTFRESSCTKLSRCGPQESLLHASVEIKLTSIGKYVPENFKEWPKRGI